MNPKQEEEPSDPYTILQVAEVFTDAANLLWDKVVAGDQHLAVAYGVNSAFACELYLKCLLSIECGQIPETHNLKKLFGQLCKRTRHQLTRRHEELAENDPGLLEIQQMGQKTDLETLLTNGQDTFVDARYLYERSAKGGTYALNLLSWCTREFILNYVPTGSFLRISG